MTPTPSEKPNSRNSERSFRTNRWRNARMVITAGTHVDGEAGKQEELVAYAAIQHVDHPSCLRCQVLIVGDYYQRCAILIQPAK